MSFLFYFYIFIYFYFYFLFYNLYFNIPLSCIIWSGVLCNDLSNIWFYLDQSTPEVHANAAETLCAITRNASSALAIKLSSPRFVLWAVLFIEHMLCTCTYFIERLKKLFVNISFVARIFGHALEDSHSKSGLVHSLSVCISLLDPKRSVAASPMFHSFRTQHMYEPPITINPETIGAMLPKLGEFVNICCLWFFMMWNLFKKFLCVCVFFFFMQNVLFDVLPFKLRMHILDAYYMSLFVLLLARVFFLLARREVISIQNLLFSI